MTDYRAIAARTAAMIEARGAPFVLTRLVNAEYDSSTGTVEGGNRKWNGTAFRWDYESKDIDGDSVRATDSRFLVSVFTDNRQAMEEPREGDRAQFDGKWSTVLACKPLKPATTAVYFVVQTRG